MAHAPHDREAAGPALKLHPSCAGPGRPTLDLSRVFRTLIAEEVRTGRLTALRRRRIIQYAAQLGLSPTEIGEFIAKCRNGVFEDVPSQFGGALRIAAASSNRTPMRWPIIVFVVLMAAGWLALLWRS